MSSEERRAGASLASLFGLRMLGLFFILPLLSVEAHKLAGGVSLASLADNPAFRAIYGLPTAVDTLGGFIAWHYAAYFALFVGLWSILALSSTLAGEAKRGSLVCPST